MSDSPTVQTDTYCLNSVFRNYQRYLRSMFYPYGTINKSQMFVCTACNSKRMITIQLHSVSNIYISRRPMSTSINARLLTLFKEVCSLSLTV